MNQEVGAFERWSNFSEEEKVMALDILSKFGGDWTKFAHFLKHLGEFNRYRPKPERFLGDEYNRLLRVERKMRERMELDFKFQEGKFTKCHGSYNPISYRGRWTGKTTEPPLNSRQFFGCVAIVDPPDASSSTSVVRVGGSMVHLLTGRIFRPLFDVYIEGYIPEVNIMIIYGMGLGALWDGEREPNFNPIGNCLLFTPIDGVRSGEVTIGNGILVEKHHDSLVIPGLLPITINWEYPPRIVGGYVSWRRPEGHDETIDLNEYDRARIFLLLVYFPGIPYEIWDRIFLFLKTYF